MSESYRPRIAGRHFLKGYPYGPELKIFSEHKNRNKKIAGLVGILGRHHPASLTHSFEVALTAVTLSPELGLGHNDIEVIFIGSLLHDIGKIGVSVGILDRVGALTERQTRELMRHGRLGANILKKVGLAEFAYFCDEHHIGNSNHHTWTKEDLDGRHPLTEIVSLSDLVCAVLDPRRQYHTPEKLETLISEIEAIEKSDVFSEQLISAFKTAMLDKRLFPPYTSLSYKENKLFMQLIGEFGLNWPPPDRVFL